MKKKILFMTILSFFYIIKFSYSYTPSSYELVRKVFKQFSFKDPLIVEQDVFKNSGKEEKESFSSAKTYIKYPSALYVKWKKNKDVKSADMMEYIVNHDRIAGKIDGDVVTLDRNDFTYSYELFSYDDINAFLKYLDSIGIDTKKITLGLYDHKVCYVIGCENLSKHSNQLWIEKDTLLPKLMVIFYSAEKGDSSFKFEFSDYSPENKLYFPNKIRYFDDDKVTLELTTTKITRAVIKKDDVFNVNNLVKSYTPQKTPKDDLLFKKRQALLVLE